MENRHFDLVRNKRIFKFFYDLKTLNPNGLYGLVLPKDADDLPYGKNYLSN